MQGLFWNVGGFLSRFNTKNLIRPQTSCSSFLLTLPTGFNSVSAHYNIEPLRFGPPQENWMEHSSAEVQTDLKLALRWFHTKPIRDTFTLSSPFWRTPSRETDAQWTVNTLYFATLTPGWPKEFKIKINYPIVLPQSLGSRHDVH